VSNSKPGRDEPVGSERLCFGTSTFVAGRLRPDKPSEPGIEALREAITAGVRLVHSNPKLDTQWAIRRALRGVDHADKVRHLIKVEAPLGVSEKQLAQNVDAAVGRSMDRLGVSCLHGVVVEIDLKRTDRRDLLDDRRALAEFYAAGAWEACAGKAVTTASAYCHEPSQVRAALTCDGITGIAAQYNLGTPWASRLLTEIAKAGRHFIGMSPLARGALVDHRAPITAERLSALRWAVADPRVHAVAVTISSTRHLQELLVTLDDSSRAASHAPI
jgi:aryl-alcohol dehydrogenase-like predicted oxidoreductase